MGEKIYKLRLKHGRCTHIDGVQLNKGALKRKRTKFLIYVIRCKTEIIYVGQSSQGIYRCAQGLTAKYPQPIAYPCRAHRNIRNSELEVMAITSFLPFYLLRDKSNREAVEADVAMKLAGINGCWPKKLTSIKVHGGLTRAKSHQHAVKNVIGSLKGNKWI